MRELAYESVLPILAERLANGGVFLNVSGARPNTMNIGWAQAGFLWAMPTITVFVRPQRYTFGLLERAGAFTVSVPEKDMLREALRLAGTLSGRDVDKFEACGLTAAPALAIAGHVVAQCPIHIECRVTHTQALDPATLDPAILKRAYPARDFHKLFFAQIVKVWARD